MRNFLIILLIPLIFGSCTNSRISSGTGSNGTGGINDENVGFNPSTTANLKTINYKAHLNRLNNKFQLNNTSDAVAYLDTNKQIFDTTVYSSSLATALVNLYSTACQEVANNTVLFPDGVSIDYIYKAFTGVEADEAAKKLETDTLALVDGQPNDVKCFALCVVTALDSKSTFIGFQTIQPTAEVTP